MKEKFIATEEHDAWRERLAIQQFNHCADRLNVATNRTISQTDVHRQSLLQLAVQCKQLIISSQLDDACVKVQELFNSLQIVSDEPRHAIQQSQLSIYQLMLRVVCFARQAANLDANGTTKWTQYRSLIQISLDEPVQRLQQNGNSSADWLVLSRFRRLICTAINGTQDAERLDLLERLFHHAALLRLVAEELKMADRKDYSAGMMLLQNCLEQLVKRLHLCGTMICLFFWCWFIS